MSDYAHLLEENEALKRRVTELEAQLTPMVPTEEVAPADPMNAPEPAV